MARSIFFSHFLRGIRHNDKFWQQWAIQFFKFCLIRFLITENPYFQNLFNQHRTVTVCIETSIHEMHYCCRGIGAYKHLSFAILWKVRKQYNPKFGLCCFFKMVLHYPPNIYLFRVVYFLYIGLGVLGNLSFSCPHTGFKSHKRTRTIKYTISECKWL